MLQAQAVRDLYAARPSSVPAMPVSSGFSAPSLPISSRTHSFSLHPFTYSFTYPFTHSFTYSFIHSCTHSLPHYLIHSILHSIIHSLIYTHSYIFFLRASAPPGWAGIPRAAGGPLCPASQLLCLGMSVVGRFTSMGPTRVRRNEPAPQTSILNQ